MSKPKSFKLFNRRIDYSITKIDNRDVRQYSGHNFVRKNWIALCIALLLFLLPAIVFLINFASADISDDISMWGTFGDYVGGVYNPIISLLNLILFVYLTILVVRFDRNRHLNEYRFKAYNILSDEVLKVKNDDAALEEFDDFLSIFSKTYGFLFIDGDKEAFENHVKAILHSIEIVLEKIDAENANPDSKHVMTVPISRQAMREMRKSFPRSTTTSETPRELSPFQELNDRLDKFLKYIQGVLIQ